MVSERIVMNTVEIGEMKTLFVDFLSQNCNDGGLFSMRLRYRLQHIFAEHRGNEEKWSNDLRKKKFTK